MSETQQAEVVPRYSIEEAAQRHGLRVWTLRQAVRSAKIEYFHIGNRFEFTDEGVTKFIDSTRQPVAA